jgi:FkbM family methyltransferase
MSLAQFINSISRIHRNPKVNTFHGVYKHLLWQARKAVNAFPVELRISSSRIIAHEKTCGGSALINNQGMYDYNNMMLITMLLKDGGCFFDIGANIGCYTLIAAEQPKAQVVSFEPHPRTFSKLADNVKLNNLGNVQLVNFAVGSEDAMVFMSDTVSSSMNSLQPGPADNAIEVRCTRIDSYCAQWHYRPDFIKIDIEGFEYDALLGFGDLLSQAKVLFIEQNGLADQRSKGDAEINTLLRSKGYQGPYKVDADNRVLHRDHGINCEDSIFVNGNFWHVLKENYRFSCRDRER